VSRRLDVALVGCGHIAVNHHIPAYRSLADQCRVVGVADPTPGRRELAAAALGLGEEAAFEDAEGLLRNVRADLVDVCTPQHLRKAIILEAIARGCHVLSEKPLAAIPADAAELVEAAAAAGIELGVLHNYLFFPEIAAAVQAVATGEVGSPEVVIVNFLGVPDLPGNEDWRPRWRHDPAASGGGVLMDMLHAVYVAEALLAANFQGVSAFVSARSPGSAVEELALCRYEAGSAAALVNVGWGHGPGGLHVSGDRGRLEVRYKDGGTSPFSPLEGVWVHGDEGSSALEVAAAGGDIAAAIGDFVDAVARGRAPRARGEDGLRALEATVAAYGAAATGRVVALPLDRRGPIFLEGVGGLREFAGEEGVPPAMAGLFGLASG
jgi:predicted dehydrogenase